MTSKRGHLLVYDGSRHPDPPVVTVENYCKWNALQVVIDGIVAEYNFDGLEPHAQTYVADHVPNPVAVVRWAKWMGFEVHGESLEMILGRWLLESGESDPAGLLAALNVALDEGV